MRINVVEGDLDVEQLDDVVSNDALICNSQIVPLMNNTFAQ